MVGPRLGGPGDLADPVPLKTFKLYSKLAPSLISSPALPLPYFLGNPAPAPRLLSNGTWDVWQDSTALIVAFFHPNVCERHRALYGVSVAFLGS
jgi:hypothetical protein